MYPADDMDVRLRLLVHQLTAMRERLREEVERSRALRAWVHATTTAAAHRPPRSPH